MLTEIVQENSGYIQNFNHAWYNIYMTYYLRYQEAYGLVFCTKGGESNAKTSSICI